MLDKAVDQGVDERSGGRVVDLQRFAGQQRETVLSTRVPTCQVGRAAQPVLLLSLQELAKTGIEIIDFRVLGALLAQLLEALQFTFDELH